MFVEAEKYSKVMVSYEKALEWQELFDLALREKMSDPDIISMGYRVAGSGSRGDWILGSELIFVFY